MVNLELRAIELKDIQVGIHIQRSRHIRILENKIIGNYSHFAEKGNGIAVLKVRMSQLNIIRLNKYRMVYMLKK